MEEKLVEKNLGRYAAVRTKKGDFEGILMPETDGALFIKLKNGYNIGINKQDILSISELKEKSEKIDKESEIKKEKLVAKKNLPTITILHTGGTIASRVDYETGAVKAQFSPEEIIELVPELQEFANIKSRLIRNMMSDDMRFSHYNLIADEIKKEIESGTDGIIITHGTDTLHYTGAALSFMLENLSIPVILVGSQRSSDRGSSDAVYNIISSAYFVSHSDFSGVAICMHSEMSDEWADVLPACKTRKLHSSRRDAFKPVNSSLIARVNFREEKIEFIKKEYPKRNKERSLSVTHFNENLKIAIVKSHPNMSADEITAFRGFDGIVLEGTGLGHMPISENDELTKEHSRIFSAIEELSKKGIVAMSTQTIFGRVDMNVYSPGRRLVEAGVIGNYSDMTPETTFIKLAWLLSNFKKAEIIKENLLLKNFRGEISERSGTDFL
ncbi:MAG: Glu-tRNA(Gln) amidotransferase subunit GatD [Candidatus Woesearchaeota archaeon]|nr:Glu-tRNA(Gln) amidotransferase subunit GatD [Candidatus Woesearchaeota archaeon]